MTNEEIKLREVVPGNEGIDKNAALQALFLLEDEDERREYMEHMLTISQMSGYIESSADIQRMIHDFLEQHSVGELAKKFDVTDGEAEAVIGAMVGVSEQISDSVERVIRDYNKTVNDLFDGSPPIVVVGHA